MTHFGIICPTAPGHLNPITTLGYELKQRGHRVTIVGHINGAIAPDKLTFLGLGIFVFRASPFFAVLLGFLQK